MMKKSLDFLRKTRKQLAQKIQSNFFQNDINYTRLKYGLNLFRTVYCLNYTEPNKYFQN